MFLPLSPQLDKSCYFELNAFWTRLSAAMGKTRQAQHRPSQWLTATVNLLTILRASNRIKHCLQIKRIYCSKNLVHRQE